MYNVADPKFTVFASGLSVVQGITAPSDVAVPGFAAVHTATLGTVYLAGKEVRGVVTMARPGTPLHFHLHSIEQSRVDDGGVGVLLQGKYFAPSLWA